MKKSIVFKANSADKLSEILNKVSEMSKIQLGYDLIVDTGEWYAWIRAEETHYEILARVKKVIDGKK